MKLNIDDEQGVELLHFIFERELKPPFRGGEPDKSDNYHYYNRDDEWIGWVDSDKDFELIGSFWRNIRDKVCSVFDVPRSGSGWWFATEPRLKSWMDAQLNIKIRHIR